MSIGRCPRWLALCLLVGAACGGGSSADEPTVDTFAPTQPAPSSESVVQEPADGAVTVPPSSESTVPAEQAATVPAGDDDDARVRATLVATWGAEDSVWLLVDLAGDDAVEGWTRVVVELDEPDVDCAGRRWPVFVVSGPEQVSFELVPGEVAARPAEGQDLRWSVPVAVRGRDLQIVCPTRDELVSTIAAQRAKWDAAGVRTYEFTLHWEVFNLSAGDYRVTLVDGQPGVLTRLDQPVAAPDAGPIDLSEIPTTMEEVFDRLESELSADRIVACYDASLGYPVDVRVDRILNAVDDELTMRISDLTIAGAPAPSAGCGSGTQPSMGSMACDVYVVGPDGTTGTTPVRSGVRGFSTVAHAEMPDEVAPGTVFSVSIPIDSQYLLATTEQYEVVAQRDFVRVFAVTGGSVVAGSVTQTPADNAPATSDQTTVSLGLATPIPGGEEVTFPAARFDVVAPDAGSVEVSLARYESTLDLRNTDGSMISIRAVCTVDPNVLASALVS